MRTIAALSLSLLFVACASSSTDGDSDGSINAERIALQKPTIAIAQLTSVGAAAEKKLTGGLPVQYQIRVTNNSDIPIKLQRVTLQTMGSGAYEISPTANPFSVTIEPRQSQDVRMWAASYIPMSSVAGANGPVTLRVKADFQSEKGKFQEIFTENITGPAM